MIAIPEEIKKSFKLFFRFPEQLIVGQVATQSRQGPRVRTMRLFDISEEGNLIFLSRTDTIKWQDISGDPKVAICFLQPNVAQIISWGNANLLTYQNHAELSNHYWNNLPNTIKQIYYDNESFKTERPPECFGIITILPHSWEIIKLAEDYELSERFYFHYHQNGWVMQKISISS